MKYYDPDELVAIFNETTPIREAKLVPRDKLADDWHRYVATNVYDDAGGFELAIQKAVRGCVKKLASMMPEVVHYATPRMPPRMPSTSVNTIFGLFDAKIQFRISITYSAALPTGETYIDENGVTQAVCKPGHMVAATACVSACVSACVNRNDMTDKEKLIELLQSFGMQEGESVWNTDYALDNRRITGLFRNRNAVLISAGRGCGGGMSFDFDKNGKFEAYGGFPW